MLQKPFWDSYKCGHYFDSYLNQITNCAVSQFVIFNFNFLESEIETLVNLALFPQNAIECSRKGASFVVEFVLGDMAIGLADYSNTLTLGRKRVVVSNDVEASPPVSTPSKKICSREISSRSEMSLLEALPQEILVQVLCGVDHEDLKQLFHVSKTIREATLIAKDLHFEYSTPKKKTFAFLNPSDLENPNVFKEIETPKAPLRKSKQRWNANLADITMALFKEGF